MRGDIVPSCMRSNWNPLNLYPLSAFATFGSITFLTRSLAKWFAFGHTCCRTCCKQTIKKTIEIVRSGCSNCPKIETYSIDPFAALHIGEVNPRWQVVDSRQNNVFFIGHCWRLSNVTSQFGLVSPVFSSHRQYDRRYQPCHGPSHVADQVHRSHDCHLLQYSVQQGKDAAVARWGCRRLLLHHGLVVDASLLARCRHRWAFGIFVQQRWFRCRQSIIDVLNARMHRFRCRSTFLAK